MKPNILFGGISLLAIALSGMIPSASAFYHPSHGRWLTRDPAAESASEGLYVFVRNSAPDAYDRLGLACCLTTIHAATPKSLAGHSILSCDNGAYVSLHPAPNPADQWHTPAQDDQDYPPNDPAVIRTTVCLTNCIGESKVAQWIADQQAANRDWTLFNNCANTTLAAIQAGLPDQPKPKCPCPSVDLALRGCYNHARNILESLDNGNSPLITLPRDAERRVQALVDNGCNQWKCTLICPRGR